MLNIIHEKVEIILKEEMYGNIPFEYGYYPVYSFYFLDKDKIEYITSRNEDFLIAVTKQQFNSWKGRKIIRIKKTYEEKEKSR